MAAVDWWAISEALAGVLADVTGEAYAYEPENPSTPCAIVRWRRIPQRGETLGSPGSLMATAEVLLLPADVIDQQAAETLLGWLGAGTGSVWAALEADSTLGGLVSDVVAAEAANVGDVSTVLGSRYGATITLDVEVTRDA